jgi:tetratricopeptide (TPR) repeat protein
MFGKNYFHLSLLVLLAACGEKEPTVPPAQTSGNQSAVVSDVTGNVNIQYKDERAATDVPAENAGMNGDQSPIINQVSGDASVQYVTNFYGANAEEVKHLQDDLKLSKQAAEALLKNLADKNVAVNSRTQEFERLARKYADLQHALGEVDTADELSHQAQAALQTGDLDKAEKLLEAAYQRDQQQADKRLGQHTLLLAQLSALKLENSKSIERYQQAVALQPDNRQAWAELALLAERVGDITLAVSAWQQVRKQTSISNAPADYLDALLHEGKVLGSSGDSTGALANYQLAQQTAQQLLAGSPQNSAWQHSLAQSYLYSGHIQRANGDMPAAQTAYQHSVELIEKLAQAEPNNRQWQRELLPVYSAVADVQREQGNAPAAIDSYNKALKIAQALVAGEPDNLERQHDVLVVLDHLGKAQQAANNPTAALEVFQQALVIGKKLSAAAPTRTDWQRSLGVIVSKLGEVSLALGDKQVAVQHFQDSLLITEQLVKLDPNNSAWQADLVIDRERIAQAQQSLASTTDTPATKQTPTLAGIEGKASVQQITTVNGQVLQQTEQNPAQTAPLTGELKTSGDQSAIITQVQGNVTIQYVTNFYGADEQAVKQLQDKLQLDKQQADALLKNLADKNVDLASRTEAFSQLAQTYVALQARLGSYAATDELAQQARKALQAGHLDVAETLLERVYARDQKLADQQLAQRAFVLAEISELKLDYPKAMVRYQEVTQRQPDNFTAWQNLALLAQKQGNTSQALQAWQQLQQNVSQTLEPAVYITGLLGEGDILFLQERNAEALKVYQSAVTASRTWHDKQPEKGRASELLASSLLSLGKLQFPQDPKQALATVEESIKWHTTLQQQSPDDTQRQRDLAVALSSAGELYRSHGDLNAAQRAHQDALKWREKLLASAKDNLQWQRDLFVSVSNMALVEGALGNDAAVLPLLQRADTLSQQLTQRDPHNREWQRDRSILLERLATAYSAKADQPAALKAQQEAWAITQALAKLDPDNQQWQRDFVTTGETLRQFYQTSDDNKALGALLAAVIPVQQRLVDLEPDNLEQKTALYLNYGRLGETHQLQNDNREALQAYQQALELNQQLAAAKPDVSAFRGEIATNLNRIGAAHFALKDNAKALAAFEEALTLFTPLAKAEPAVVEWQLGIVGSKYQMAQIVADQHDALLQEAIAILEKLQQEKRLPDAYKTWPEEMRKALKSA